MLRRVPAWVVIGAVVSGCGTNIDLTVPATIAVSNTLVVVAASLGAGPASGTVTIINGTDGTLEGIAATVESNGPPATWLTASLSGTTATRDQATTLTLTAQPEGLALGTYDASVRISAEGAPNSPVVIRVQFTVRPRPPSKLQVVTQPAALATNGTPLAPPPVVQLLNALDEPALEAGVVISVAVTGGGTLSGATSVATDANGRATFTDLTITGGVGQKTLVFSAPNLPETSSSSITLQAGGATRLEAVSALTQTADAGQAVGDPPRVRVVDQSGNPINNFDVGFVASAGSTIAPSGTIKTTATGLASLTSWVLRPAAGANTVIASASGLEGSPITFTATGQVGPPATLAKQSGDNLIGLVGTTLGTPHVVKVSDAAGNGVPNVTVTWAVTGAGSVAPTTGTTDADGLASATRTLGPNPGNVGTTATVTINGAPVSVAFAVTAANAGPAQIVKVEGDNQSAQAGTTLPIALKVQVLDALSAPLAGVAVTFTTPNAGGTFPSGSPATTDANGFASATWRLGGAAGTQTAQAAVGGPAPVTFTATALSGPVSATQSTITATPGSITAGGGASTIEVTARDAGGNLVSGAAVVLAVNTGTGITQPAGPTGANGKATGSYASTVAGSKTISATVGGVLLNSTAQVTVQPGAAAQMIAVTATAFSVRFGLASTTLPRIRLVDAFGNRVPGVSIQFAVTSGSSSVLSPTNTTTNANGEAAVSSWTVAAFSPATITSTAFNVINSVRATATGGGIVGNPTTFTGTAQVMHAADLQPFWNSFCTSCHAGGQPPTLSGNARPNLINTVYVTVSDSSGASASKNKLIFWPTNVNPGAHSGSKVSDRIRTIIAAWIQQGALP